MAVNKDILADVSLLVDFANTLDERSFSRHGATHGGRDEFATAADAQRWLAGHDLLAEEARLTPGEFAELLTLRNGLRRALAAKFGASPDALALTKINAELRKIPLVMQFSQGGMPQLAPRTGGAAAASALLAARIAAAASRGNWHRLRMCAATDCHWVFYDTSRSGGGRWCSMAVCGNRVKTRRYRQRQAQAAAG